MSMRPYYTMYYSVLGGGSRPEEESRDGYVMAKLKS